MREIKFRGKLIESDNVWVYSNSILQFEYKDDLQLWQKDNGWRDIKSETVGQYIGLKDKNGKEIYEGDILNIDKEDYKYVVKYYDGCFVGVNKFDEHFEQAKIIGNLFTLEIEVIGNIYENQDLLKEV